MHVLPLIIRIGQTYWPTLPVPLGHLTAGIRVWPLPMSSANSLPCSFSQVFRDLLFHVILSPLKLFRWSLSLKDTFIHVLAERCPPPLSSHAVCRLQKLSTTVGIRMCYGGDLPSQEVGKDQFFLHGHLICCSTCKRSRAGLCPLSFVRPSANINGPGCYQVFPY